MMEWPAKILIQQEPKANWAFKVLLVGDAGVGKTALMCSIADQVFIDNYQSTLGSSFGALRVYLDTLRVQMQLWNITDLPEFETIRPVYYRGGAGAIYVFSITNPASFQHISEWAQEVKKYLGNIPAILVGTRKKGRKTRKVKRKDAQKLAKHLGIPYYEIEPESGPKFEELIQILVSGIINPKKRKNN